MRKIGIALALIAGTFFIVRAIVELLVIDFSDPQSYASDWGGPSLVGVLLVHCGPGVIAAIALGMWWRASRSSRPDEPTRPPDHPAQPGRTRPDS